MSGQITYQRCAGCGHAFHFPRDFCPRCGGRDVPRQAASGRGRIHASTVVERAPTPEFRALAPYTIALVDTAEGFRLMAHAEAGVKIGDEVTGVMVECAGHTIPYFKRFP